MARTTKELIAIIIVMLLCFVAAPTLEGMWDDPLQKTTCEEDQSCWNCETMGNKICGPELGDD